MAQPKLEFIDLKLARDIGDQVSTAGTNGFNFTAAQRLEAINEARHAIYLQSYLKYPPEQFADLFPEYRKIVTIDASSIEAGGYEFVKPVNIRYVFTVQYQKASGVKTTEKLEDEFYYDAKNNTYSIHKPSSTLAKWIDINGRIEILFTSAVEASDKVNLLCLVIPDDAILGGENPDIKEQVIFRNAITDKALEIMKTGIQS